MPKYYVKVDFYVLERRHKKWHSCIELSEVSASKYAILDLLHKSLIEHTIFNCKDVTGKLIIEETWKITSI